MRKEIHILLLEDDAADAELTRFALRKGGLTFSLIRVETKEQYVKALEENALDLILSDYSLPGFNGADALQIAQEKWPRTPFIFVTGTMGEEVAIETLKSGATDYVLKTRLSRLLPAVNRALREAEEEVGLKREDVTVLGHIDELLTVSQYRITPVVGVFPWPFLDLAEFALGKPELFTTGELNRLVMAALGVGAMGSGAADPQSGAELLSKFTKEFTDRLGDAESNKDCMEATQIKLAGLALNNAALKQQAGQVMTAVC